MSEARDLPRGLKASLDSTSSLLAGRAALLSAHPGHELRIHGWLEAAQPMEFVLTDGSGGAGVSRIGSTRRVLEGVGGQPGSWFGLFTDREVYERILERQTEVFLELARGAATMLAQTGVSVVVADETEGYNPVHDLCFGIAAAAARLASRRSGRAVALYAHFLCPSDGASGSGELERFYLSGDTLARKIEAARSYAELAPEVGAALRDEGESAFRTETFRRVDLSNPPTLDPGSTPFYEQYGERQVAAGRYSRILRYREHVLPVARALAELSATPAW